MGVQALCSFHRSILLKTMRCFGQVTCPVFILLTSLLYQPARLTSNMGLVLNGLYHCRVSQLEPSYERCSRREKARAHTHTRPPHTIHTHTPHTHSPHTIPAHTEGGEGGSYTPCMYLIPIHPDSRVEALVLLHGRENGNWGGSSGFLACPQPVLLPCGKLTPRWPVARQTSVSREGKCWAFGDTLRATFQKQLFPGVAAPGLQSEGSPLDSGHGPRQEELVPGAAVVTC